MARRALSTTCLTLVRALEEAIPPAVTTTGVNNVRVGLSGGADSLALTAALAWARDHRKGPLAGIEASVRIVDHGLQPGSATVAATAAQQATDLGFSAEVVRVDVDPAHIGVEAAARNARYAALTAGDSALVLLAHTLDDQAETVLLGLARGSGTRSLSGMPARREFFVRPFLSLRRAQTEQACRDWGLTWWDDPTNTDFSYARSRVRSVMNELDALLGPGLPEALARTADLCRTDADHLDAEATAQGIDPSQPDIPLTDLLSMPTAIRQRILLSWLRETGGDAVTREHVLAVDALVTHWHGQKGISVPGGKVVREKATIRLIPGK